MGAGSWPPAMSQEFTFRIAGSYSPENIPMARLGEYLRAFGELLGEQAYVHFEAVRPGSTVLVAAVEHVAVPKVAARVRKMAAGDCNEDERAAYRRVDDMLREDNATGQLVGRDGNVIHVQFEGRNRPEPIVYGPIKQLGTIDGEIIRVEGSDDTVHVGVKDGSRTYKLFANEARGRELAALFRAGPVRFTGEGTWQRTGGGTWELKKFRIQDFHPLNDGPLSDAISALQGVGLGGWKDAADPLGDLAAERSDREVRH